MKIRENHHWRQELKKMRQHTRWSMKKAKIGMGRLSRNEDILGMRAFLHASAGAKSIMTSKRRR
jgi:hypothetical protein